MRTIEQGCCNTPTGSFTGMIGHFKNPLGAIALIAIVFVAALSPKTTAVVIRHDRSDADALRLGERFDAIGKVLPDGGCTLIAPKWAITAAHVAAQIPHDGQIQFGDKRYGVKRVFLHPEGSSPKGVPPEVDLALIELAEPVTQLKPIELYRKHDELGRTAFIVGYGDYGNPQSGLKHSDGKRRAVTNVVDDAGPRRIFFTFDAPPKGTEYEGVGGPGDSGGPAIIEQEGKLLLAGVSSASMNGKPGQYGVTDVYTRVSSYIDWIENTMNHAPSAEQPPAQPRPGASQLVFDGPRLSAGSSRGLFGSNRTGVSPLYVMNVDGSNTRRLIQTNDMTLTPSTLAEGHWEGAITREGKTWRVNLDIESRPTGPVALVDLVDYAVYDIPFTVTAESNKLRVERKQPTGATVSFIGTVDGDTFSGEFTGVGVKAPFRLRRTDKTPVVFKEEEVTFHNGDVTLAGTLIIPKGPSPHPAIVVTHGGGPDSRQKNAYRSDGYFFAHLGVAALIYDKRGVGKSSGDYQTASLEDLADDALAGVHLLKARKDIDGRHIGVMGTSQGGWISPLAATRSSDVAFIIVISAAGINPMEQSIFNIESVLKGEGYSPEVINRATELRNRLYARARTGSFDANFLADIEKAHTEPWFKLSELPYPVAPSLSEGTRRFLLFEPAPTWEKVKVPVLALWGEDDIYLPAQKSMSIVEASLTKGGNKKSTLKMFPHAEHGLSVVRAPADGWDFPRAVPGSRELIADWIVKQVGVKNLAGIRTLCIGEPQPWAGYAKKSGVRYST